MSARKIMVATLLAVATFAPSGVHAAPAPTAPYVAGPDVTDGADLPVTEDLDLQAAADDPGSANNGYKCDMVPLLQWQPDASAPNGEAGTFTYTAHMSCNFTARAIDVYAILERKQGNGSWEQSSPHRATCMNCAAPSRPATGSSWVWVIDGEAQSQWRVRGIFEVRFPSTIKARRFSTACSAPDGQFVGCLRFSSTRTGP